MIVHLNGRLMPAAEARVSPFDRGFLLGEGIYEGLRAFRGRIVALDRHVERMRNGLRECRMGWEPEEMGPLSEALLRANGLTDAFIYWQVTRGAPAAGQPVRARVPSGPQTPTVLGYCTPQPPIEAYTEPPTVTAVMRPDTRWMRGHVKATSLLGNVLAAIEAREAGAADAILVRDGLVTEGTATNVIVALPRPDGSTELATPALESVSILAGVTRSLELDYGPGIVARPVRAEELKRASEIMLLGSTSMVTSVVSLDGEPVGDGRPGPQAHRMLAALLGIIRRELALDAPGDVKPTTLRPCRTSPAGA